MAAAGNVAHNLYLRNAALWDEGLAAALHGDHDLRLAEEKLAPLGFTMHHGPLPPHVRGASWDAVNEQVEHTLVRLWPQVEEVAAVLLASFRISGDEVRSVVGHAEQSLDLESMVQASRVHRAAEQPPQSASLSRLTALAERVSAESQQRTSQAPSDTTGTTRASAPHAQSQHALNRQQHAPDSGHVR